MPFGFRLERGENGSRLVADPEEQEVRLWIHDRYLNGWGADRIARELNKRGIPTQRGRTWERASVTAILFRAIQVGAREAEASSSLVGTSRRLCLLRPIRRPWPSTRADAASRRRVGHRECL